MMQLYKPKAGGLRQLLLLVSALFFLLAGCSPPLVKLSRTESHMGTGITITVLAGERGPAGQAMAEAFAEFARLDSLLSHYKEDSEVTRLNEQGRIENPSEDLRVNIEKSLEYGRLSRGAFDITVLPVLDLYGKAFQSWGRAPTDQEVREILKRVDYRRLSLDPEGISLGRDQKITLGGIAKGYAVDRAVEVLKARGIRRALVDAGGDIRTLGKRGDGQDWLIALRNPRDEKDYITRIRAADMAVVTSGDYERYFDPEKRFHHIVNPRTGYSATELISVTIVADRAVDADAISTSVFVLGPVEGLKLIESLPGVEGLIIIREREIIRSSNFKAVEG